MHTNFIAVQSKSVGRCLTYFLRMSFVQKIHEYVLLGLSYRERHIGSSETNLVQLNFSNFSE